MITIIFKLSSNYLGPIGYVYLLPLLRSMQRYISLSDKPFHFKRALWKRHEAATEFYMSNIPMTTN